MVSDSKKETLSAEMKRYFLGSSEELLRMIGCIDMANEGKYLADICNGVLFESEIPGAKDVSYAG